MRNKGQAVRILLIVVALIAAVLVVKVLPAPDRGSAPTLEPVVADSNSDTNSTPQQTASPSSSTPSRDVHWERVARSFVSRYGNTKGGRAAWLQRLRPVVSQDVYAGLQTVRLENLPSGTFTTGAVLRTAEVGGAMRFPLRNGPIGGLDVTVSVTDEGTLRVTRFVPVRDGGVA